MTDSPCVTVRDMLTDLLYARCHEAMRMPQIVGNETYVTPWDKAHTAINELLDTLVGR
jgi:hypothetical protein